MKIYFLSSLPCALTLNGAYFGLTDRFERFADVALKDGVFVQFSPANALPNGFFLTEDIRFHAPTGAEVYLLKDGIAVFARDFAPVDLALKTHAQKRFDKLLVTLFTQGVTQVSLESERGFFVKPLPPTLSQANIDLFNGLIFIHTDNELAIFTQTGDTLFHEQILDFSVNKDELFVNVLLSDSLQRIAECRYALSENACSRTACILKQASEDPAVCPDGLLCFAFFESVLLGADYARFLSDELRSRATEIMQFVGAFESVVPTDKANECGLVRQIGERLFSLDYYNVEIQDGKITDIRS
ncbi:MAG: hypothetical protein IJ317_01370 [Clostridia bacterium]|nr:hypothetical protein [Clostridia bacterium]